MDGTVMDKISRATTKNRNELASQEAHRARSSGSSQIVIRDLAERCRQRQNKGVA